MEQAENPRPEFPHRSSISLYGVYPAVVVDNVDPENQGRVQVQARVLEAQGYALGVWARLATLMAGDRSGTWFIPDIGSEVLVTFEGGDASRPYVIGGLWNEQAYPPESMDGSGNNYTKVIRSRNGLCLTLDDSDGKESLTLETPGGQKLTLKDGPGVIEITDSSGNSVALETSGITIKASAKVTIKASMVEVSAAMLSVNAGLSRFSGTVQADTIIANSVVSDSYTPGAGNIW